MSRQLLFLLFFLGATCLGLQAAQERPNFVFILVDDLRWDALGCMGNKIVKSPHIDRLATEGVLFENAFVTTSICSVSRASIFSGQWMRRHGIQDFAKGFTDEQWTQGYPSQLKGAGYQLGFVGKFGVGNVKEITRRAADFDYWKGDEGQGGKHFIEPGDPTRTHKTARFGGEALDFLQACTLEKSFCLSVSFNAVHARDGQPREFEPDPRDEGLYVDDVIPLPATASEAAYALLPEAVKKSEGRRRWGWRFDDPEKAQRILKDYYRLITGVDRELGRIRETLQQRGLAENTVIIFTSDNGFALGDRGLADKWFMWEEDIRVASIVYDPRSPADKRGKRVKQMTLNVDFAPTLLTMAGIPVPDTMQGRNLVPLLQGETPADWRTEFFYEHLTLPKMIPPVEGVRTERWKYFRWVNTDPVLEEMYDLQTDPLEQRNLAHKPEHAAKLEELRARWQTLAQEMR